MAIAHRDLKKLGMLIRNEVNDVERGDDAQMAAMARFLATMCDVRVAAGVPAFVGHEAMRCATESLSLRLASREKSLELHRHLADLAGAMRMPELAEGGYDKPPSGALIPAEEAERTRAPASA